MGVVGLLREALVFGIVEAKARDENALVKKRRACAVSIST